MKAPPPEFSPSGERGFSVSKSGGLTGAWLQNIARLVCQLASPSRLLREQCGWQLCAGLFALGSFVAQGHLETEGPREDTRRAMDRLRDGAGAKRRFTLYATRLDPAGRDLLSLISVPCDSTKLALVDSCARHVRNHVALSDEIC
jgi:hypothetical protein